MKIEGINKIIMPLLLGCLLAANPAAASFEDTEIGAKAASLAGAYMSEPSDISGIFYNPAGLALLKRAEALAAYDRMYAGLADKSVIGNQLAGFGMPFKFGSVGVAWHRLSLSGLYKEDTIKFGYARKFGRIYAGVNASSLSVGYGEDEYTELNPVFINNGYKKSGMGIDAGVIYYGEWMSLALSGLNLNEPDLGLEYANKVTRKLGLGISLKRRVLDLNAAAVISGGDYRFKTGIETWVYKRQVSVRGGVSVGTHKYRNAALGVGYQRDNYGADYAFVYPLSGISNTYGSHQLSFVYRFGKVKEEEPAFTWKDLVELAKKTEKKEEAPSGEEAQKEMEVKADLVGQAQEQVIEAKADYAEGLYGTGLEKLKKAGETLKDDKEVTELVRKGKNIVAVTPEVKGPGKKNDLIRKSINAYMENNGGLSLDSIRYASQIYPGSAVIEKLIGVIRTEFQDIAEQEKLVPGIDLVTQKLQRALEMIYSQKFVDAVGLCMDVLELEPENVLALMRMGSAYWAMGQSDKARTEWRKALALDPGNEQLMDFLKMKKPEPKAAPAGAVKPAEEKKAAPEVKKVDATVQKEYENGLNYYERIKKYGAGKSTLESVLRRIVDKFKDSGINMDYVYQELKKYE